MSEKEFDMILCDVSFRRELRWTFALLLLLCLILAGCRAVGPNFVRPETEVPGRWVSVAAAPKAQPGTAEADLQRWWKVFSDANLNSLMEQAFNSNLDLRIATSRIRQARASCGIAASGTGPTVDASGSFRRLSRSE